MKTKQPKASKPKPAGQPRGLSVTAGWAPLKRYVACNGSVYYPSGGMDDFFGDFDTQDEAVAAVTAHAEKENPHDTEDLWRYSWAHVWDSAERRNVWENP